MEICLLGELEVWDRGARLQVRGLKQRALLALLALQRGASAGADRLVEGVWGDDVPANGLNALRMQIAQLRRAVGADAVVTTGAGYVLVGVDVDVVRFEQLVAEGRALLAVGDVSGADLLRQALALRRGEPLAEFASFEFAMAERARLNELGVLAVEARIEADLALGRHADVIGELESLCREYPLREGLWVLRMTALYRVGRQSEALRCFTEARERLAEELGIAPGAELQRAEAMVLAHDPALDLDVRASVASPQPQLRRSHLRASLTSFVGRDEEVVELCARSRRARLVTLIGPGGVGKTRLAVEAAHRLAAESSDPVWMVELAGVSDPDGVGAAVARALGVADVAGGGARAMSAVDAVVAQLLGTSALVVVDNCEHVVAEAAAVIDELLGALPQLRVIATSREILGVPGEALTQIGGLETVAAAELFADRAAAVNGRFVLDEGSSALVEDICARLDGLPLAIELAAARLRTLSLAQLASRLDDRFRLLTGGARTAMARQQTLKAVVDWSYELLSGDEQTVFAGLAVFRGDFALDAAEAVCSDDRLPAGEVLEVLQRLVDKSLVDAGTGLDGEARFSQLQTLWQYGYDRLAESGAGADAVGARHAAYFKVIAEAARDSRSSPAASRQRLNAELDNVRRALEWFVERGDAEAALSLSVGTGWLFFTRADFHQGARWVADALGVPGDVPNGLRCLAHAWHGYFRSFVDGSATHVAECEAASSALRGEDEDELRADTLLLTASTLNRARQRGTALDVLERSRPLLERIGDPWRLGLHGLISALTLENSGRLDEADLAARDSARRFGDADDEWWIIEPLGILAGIAEDRGDLDGAADAYKEVVESCRAVGGEFFEPRWLSRLAAVRARQGNDAEADRLYRETITNGRNPLLTAAALLARARVVRRLGDLDESRRLLDDGMARYQLLGIATGCAAAFAGLAWWALAVGDHAAAAAFAEQASSTARGTGDAHSQLVSDSVLAAVAVVVDPSEQHRRELAAIAQRRAFSGGVYAASLDELDVFSLAERYPPAS